MSGTKYKKILEKEKQYLDEGVEGFDAWDFDKNESSFARRKFFYLMFPTLILW
jgi:hypothetical protein